MECELKMNLTGRKQELWSICKHELNNRGLGENYKSRLNNELQMLTENVAGLFLFTHQCMKEAGVKCYDINIRGTFANLLVSYLLDISELDPVQAGVSHLFFLGRDDRKVIDLNIPMKLEVLLVGTAKKLLAREWGDVFCEVKKENCIWACEDVPHRCSLFFQKFSVLDKLHKELEARNMNVQDIPLDDKTISAFFYLEKMKKEHPYPFNHEYPTMILEEIEFSIHGLNDLAKVMGLMHGSDIWLENMRPFVCRKDISLNEAISSRDDVWEILINAGYDENTAFKLSHLVYTGKQKESQEWKTEMIKNQGIIPKWQFDCINTVKYLFPHMHSLSYAIVSWRLMWLESLDEA